MSTREDYLQLHLVIFLAGSVPLVSKVIEVPAVQLIALRTLIALPLVWLACLHAGRARPDKGKPARQLVRVPLRAGATLAASGLLTAAFWILLAFSAQIARPSVTNVGAATIPIFVTLLRPVMVGKPVKFTEVMTGLNAVFGFFMIFNSGFDYEFGLVAAVLAAFFAALLTTLQAQLVSRYHHLTVTFYQMAGAFVGASLTQFALWAGGYAQLWYDTRWADWALIAGLAFFVSVYAYSAIIKVMRSLSPFTVALTNNLAPIYGILASLLYFGKQEVMGLYFYAGAFIIVVSIFAYPLARWYFGASQEGAVSGRKAPEAA